MLSLLVTAAAFTAPKSSVQSALKLRGGVGLDAGDAAKMFVQLNMYDGALKTLSQSGASDIYTLFENSGEGLGILGYYLFANSALDGNDLAKTIVLGNLPALTAAVKDFIANPKVDLSEGNLSLLVTALVTYSLHTGTLLDGDLAIKIAAGWNLVNGLSGWLAPDIAAKLPWEGSASSGQAQLATGVGAAIYALNTGKDATQAIGYSVLPSLVGGLMDGMPEGNAMVSTLIQATVVAATLF